MKKINVYASLRLQLGMIAIILIVIPVFLVSYVYTTFIKEVIVNKYTETAIQSVYETSEILSFIMDDIVEYSTVIVSNGELLEMLRNEEVYNANDYGRVLRSFMTSRDDVEVIELKHKSVNYTIGAKITEGNDPEVAISGQPRWLATQDYSIEILSGEFRRHYFTLARSIIDYNTLDNYGTLLIRLEENVLEQTYSSLNNENVSDVFIVNGQGTVISHPDKMKLGSTIRFKPFSGSLLESKASQGTISYMDGEAYLAMYSSIGGSDWRIVKTVPEAYLYEEVNQVQQKFIQGAFIYGIMIILFMIIFAIRYTEPMMRMKNVMKKVEEGDFTARTAIESKNELGQLGESLDNMIEEMDQLIRRLIKEEQDKKEVELEALHAQINPHFLYNTLNTIRWMAKIQGNQKVSKAITSLVKLLRISINLGLDMILLKDEIEYVKNYMIIQNLRYNEAVHMTYEVEATCSKYLVPKLILQPIVENAIIYSLDEAEEIHIDICVKEVDGFMHITVTDDGPGMSEEKIGDIFGQISDRNRFSKVGLNNVNQRIKMRYGQDYGVAVQSKLGFGTEVHIMIPAIVHENQTGTSMEETEHV